MGKSERCIAAWALVFGPPVQCLQAAGALATSTITSDAALLSGTSRKEVAKDATGGLLRRIGDRGVLV